MQLDCDVAWYLEARSLLLLILGSIKGQREKAASKGSTERQLDRAASKGSVGMRGEDAVVQGAPFNIKDFKVLLDAQVYEDLEGRWVDLFNRMKWDIIKSVLKSVAGLQGRKFKVWPPTHVPCMVHSTHKPP